MGIGLKFKTVKGIGSEFWFSLDVEDIPILSQSPNHQLVPDDSEDIPNEKTKILMQTPKKHKSSIIRKKARRPIVIIVDDTDLNRFVLHKIAEKVGVNIKIAECINGLEAVKLFIDKCLRKSRKTLIFMDIDMPIMNGFEATRRIRKFKSIERPIIIAVTAYDMNSVKERCKDLGCDGFLTKPILSSNIVKLINSLFV